MHLSLEAIERTLDRLAQLALVRPASLSNLPSNNRFTATRLILREFMHHLQFDDITVLASNPSDATQ